MHSVIVHEGEANVGHYWAYISSSSLSSEQNKEVSWRKFNDKSVEPATWQQIEEDSFGSRRACSAYCLVYTRMKCEAVLYGEGIYFYMIFFPAVVLVPFSSFTKSTLLLDLAYSRKKSSH